MLKIRNLTKKFGAIKAIDGLNLDAEKGETVVLMGPSGCGKSTTIRTINRLIEPDAGAISFDGIDITHLPQPDLLAMRKRIGYVFQQFNLIARLSALENVMLGLVMGHIPREDAEMRARSALARVGLEDHLSHRPSELSGGQQQRIAIARALAFEPELMLWDEPTASLDPILVREVLVIMEELVQNRMSTMLIVTHELAFALNVADRIILMDSGRIVEEGPANEIFLQPQSAVGKNYRDLIEYQINAGKKSFLN